MFIKLLELIGCNFTYDKNQEIDEYRLSPYDGVKKLETLQNRISFLNFDLINKTIKIPSNLSIIATMNTSDNSIYHMDSAFKRRWDWEFVDINSNLIKSPGNAFSSRQEWEKFVHNINKFIKNNNNYIRGIEDKQIGKYFIKNEIISKADIQNKLMFFIWDSVFPQDKKPLMDLLNNNKLVTFGDFSSKVDDFINAIKEYYV